MCTYLCLLYQCLNLLAQHFFKAQLFDRFWKGPDRLVHQIFTVPTTINPEKRPAVGSWPGSVDFLGERIYAQLCPSSRNSQIYTGIKLQGHPLLELFSTGQSVCDAAVTQRWAQLCLNSLSCEIYKNLTFEDKYMCTRQHKRTYRHNQGLKIYFQTTHHGVLYFGWSPWFVLKREWQSNKRK